MKDYQKLQSECISEVLDAGITPSTNIVWLVNSRAKARWGLCTKVNEGDYYEIQISNRLLDDDRVSEKDCKTTIIHEILHTCQDCMKHTGKWKEYANIMNQKYGYNIKRTTSYTEKGLEKRIIVRKPVKYIFICKKCLHAVRYKKKCKFTKYYRNYSCSVCGQPRAYRKVEFADNK